MTKNSFEAMIFDLDGVLTDSASLHFRAWKETFDELLASRTAARSEPFADFTSADYARDVDGKPRYQGVASFLATRGIDLPVGEPSDLPSRASVCGVGNLKNDRFNQLLDSGGASAFPGSLPLLEELVAAHCPIAVGSSSRNARRILRAAGLDRLFSEIVDGEDVLRDGMAGKPAPDIFLEACRRLGVLPDRSVVFEDAIVGVQAAVAGGFALVVGVARRRSATSDLAAEGAHRVVADLAELDLETLNSWARHRWD